MASSSDNPLAKIKNISKPYKGFTNLKIGYHRIDQFRLVKNKFSESEKSLLIELANEVVYMPQYYANCIEESDIPDLNGDERSYLYFGGRRAHNK